MGHIILWQLNNGEILNTINGTSEVLCLKRLNDTLIVVSFSDMTLIVWEITNGIILKTLDTIYNSFQNTIIGIDLLNNNMIAGISVQGPILIWNADSYLLFEGILNQMCVYIKKLSYCKLNHN